MNIFSIIFIHSLGQHPINLLCILITIREYLSRIFVSLLMTSLKKLIQIFQTQYTNTRFLILLLLVRISNVYKFLWVLQYFSNQYSDCLVLFYFSSIVIAKCKKNILSIIYFPILIFKKTFLNIFSNFLLMLHIRFILKLVFVGYVVLILSCLDLHQFLYFLCDFIFYIFYLLVFTHS